MRKIKAASQQQGLLYSSFKPVVALLHVSVLVGAPGLTLAPGEPVVFEQGLVALSEFLSMRIASLETLPELSNCLTKNVTHIIAPLFSH